MQSRIEQDRIAEEVEEISAECKNTNATLQVVQAKLEIAVERHVPKDPVGRRNEVFAIYKNPGDGAYKVIRCQYRTARASIANCCAQGYSVCIYRKEDPNAVNIWNRAKVALVPALGTIVGGYYIHLARGASEEQLLALIKSVEEVKRNV